MMIDIDLTIFTPTYNRAHTLVRTYKSLCNQTDSRFEWLIVDDGSQDNTKQYVERWIHEEKISIRYVAQENAGKHVALNHGVQLAKGYLFFTVDSDDWLPSNAVELILKQKQQLTPEGIAGIIALKSLDNKKIIGTSFPDNLKYASAYGLTKMGFGGERSFIIKTSILKRYPYPQISGEKFMGEAVVYDQIDRQHKYLIMNNILTICEYQPDGLSNNIFRIMLQNPCGYKIYYAQRIDIATTLKEKISYIIHYWAFALMSSSKTYSYQGQHQFLVRLCFPLGCCAYLYYKRKKIK